MFYKFWEIQNVTSQIFKKGQEFEEFTFLMLWYGISAPMIIVFHLLMGRQNLHLLLCLLVGFEEGSGYGYGYGTVTLALWD